MTHERDIDRLLDHWFSDGPTEAPDRVMDVVADRIGHQSQRSAWRLDWRHAHMTMTFKLATTAAAVVIIAIIGYNLLPGSSTGAGTESSPTPTPDPTPTPALLPAGTLAPGAYLTHPVAGDPAFGLTLTVPDGWSGFPDQALVGPGGTTPPGGIGLAFLLADGIHADPCHWDHLGTGSEQQPGDIAVGQTVEDLVNALRANRSYTTTTPTNVTVGGYAGRQLMLEVPTDIDLASCDGATYWLWGTPAGEAAIYVQGPGNRWDLRIVDVAGTRLIIAVDDYAATPTDAQASARSIVDSIQFYPTSGSTP
jgi:hypothetical protein